MRRFPKPSPALLIACLALFVALGPAAYATHEVINSSDVVDESLRGVDVRGKAGTSTTPAVNGSLTGADISGQPANAANGTPYVNGSLSGHDIAEGSVRAVDLANGAVTGAKVADGSLTGTDINEGSLETVTSSVLGGLGRSAGPSACNPESDTYVNCNVTVTLDLPRPARVLVIGSVRAENEDESGLAAGGCQLGTTAGPVPGSNVFITVEGVTEREYLSIEGVTGVFPAGQHAFGVDCAESVNIYYDEARVTAVALSDR